MFLEIQRNATWLVPPVKVDVHELERWLADLAASRDISSWRVEQLDIWPLFTTCLVSLAIQIHTRHRKALGRVGGRAWRSGVRVDYHVAAPLRWMAAGLRANLSTEDRLAGRILYYCSKVHTRTVGDAVVSPPIDVPATLMRQAGRDGVLWIEDLERGDARLTKYLTQPARGVADLMRSARAGAWRHGVAGKLDELAGFAPWCAAAADRLGFSAVFLRRWLARQAELALAAGESFGQAIDQSGHPAMLVLLNGGFATTVGLVAAAKQRHIPVVEVQHGADSEGTVTSLGMEPHFSTYNCAPDALISWESTQRIDDAVLAVGPIGLHMPAVLAKSHATDGPAHRMLCATFEAQHSALAAAALGASLRHEVLVSLQPGDRGEWLVPLAMEAGPDILFWVRRHGSDLSSGAAALDLPAATFEVDLASSSALSHLLSRVGAHITRFSAVALEAAACGVPTMATEAYAEQLYARSIPAQLLQVETETKAAGQRLRQILDQGAVATGDRLPDVRRIVPFLEARMSSRGASANRA